MGEIMIVVTWQSELEMWVRCASINGNDAAMILSDVSPNWSYVDKSGQMDKVQTFCLLPTQTKSCFAAKQYKEINPLRRFKESIDKKLEQMRQDFAEGEKHAKSLEDWVNWAIDKNFKINWLEYVLERGFFKKILKRIKASKQWRRRYMPIAYYKKSISTANPTEEKPQNCQVGVEKETTEQRSVRIVNYVNNSRAQGKTVKTALAELAKIEGCGSHNIKRLRDTWTKKMKNSLNKSR